MLLFAMHVMLLVSLVRTPAIDNTFPSDSILYRLLRKSETSTPSFSQRIRGGGTPDALQYRRTASS